MGLRPPHAVSSDTPPPRCACLCPCVCMCARDASHTCWHLRRGINVLLSPVPLQSQAEAHYKGNRHARRVKGIETSKSRPQEGEKPHAVPAAAASPSPGGAAGTGPDSEPSKSGERSSGEPVGACVKSCVVFLFAFFVCFVSSFMPAAISTRRRAQRFIGRRSGKYARAL